MKILLLSSLLILGGCATCHDHPVACSIAGVIIVGSIAAGIHNSRNENGVVINVRNPECADGVIGSDFNSACHRYIKPAPIIHPIGH
jgi:hypothetical protein